MDLLPWPRLVRDNWPRLLPDERPDYGVRAAEYRLNRDKKYGADFVPYPDRGRNYDGLSPDGIRLPTNSGLLYSSVERIRLRDWKNWAKGVFAGAITGTALGLGGFWLAEIPATHAMGWVMFFVVPVSAGFA